MAGFWDDLGRGLQDAGAILSPKVYENQNAMRTLQVQQQNRQNELLATHILSGIQNGSVNKEAGMAALSRIPGLGGAAGSGFGPSPAAQNDQMILQLNKQALGGGLGTPTLGAPPAAAGPAAPPQSGATPTQPASPQAPVGPAAQAYQQAVAQLQTPQGQAMMASPMTAPRITAQLQALRGAAELELQQANATREATKPIFRVTAISDTQQQDQQSTDNGKTWVPVSGSAPRPIFPPEKPGAEKTAFMKEQEALDKLIADGKGNTPAAKALKRHLDKMDAPSAVTVNAGRQALDAPTREFMAQQYLAGDKSVLTGLARNPIEMGMMRQEIVKQAKAKGMSPAAVGASIAEFGGMMAGERTLGTRTANIEMAATEAASLATLAKTASESVSRTGVKSFNDIQQAIQKRTASPELRAFVASNTSLINAYARAINPQGVGTVADKEHARDMLDTAFSKGDYSATVDQLLKEIDAAQRSPGTVREDMRNRFTGQPTAAPAAAPSLADKDRLKKKYGLN